MTVALRRSARVGRFAGQFVEDVGVKPEVKHDSDSIDDLLSDQPSMLARACQFFGSQPLSRVDLVDFANSPDGAVTGHVRTTGISALKFFADQTPAGETAVAADGTLPFRVPPQPNGPPATLRIEGYVPVFKSGVALVAVRTAVVLSADAAAR
jgi:hypothetical protein